MVKCDLTGDINNFISKEQSPDPQTAKSMSSYLVRAIGSTRNIIVRPRTEVVGGGGDGRLEHLMIADGTDDTSFGDNGTARSVSVNMRQ